jgi:hypothetical protein
VPGGSGCRAQVLRIDWRDGARILPALDQVRAPCVDHLRARLRGGRSDAGERRHRLRGRSVVVPEQRHQLVRIRADDRDRPHGLRQRQHTVVLEEHDRLVGHFPRQPIVLGRLVDAVRNLRVAHALGRVEHPELESGAHQAANRHVDVLLGDQSLREGAIQRSVRVPALEVAAPGHAERRRLFGRLDDLVELVDIVDRAAVRDDVAVEAPVAAKDVDEQPLAGGCRVAVHAVVRAHD